MNKLHELSTSSKYITLGELRDFINIELKDLPDDVPCEIGIDCGPMPLHQILADEESLEFYNYENIDDYEFEQELKNKL